MARPALVVSVEWFGETRVSTRVRAKVEAMVRELAPQLNEFEAQLWDLHRIASNGLDYLMPKIELTLPLYEDRQVFRLRLVRYDETQIFVETRKGEAVGEVRLH